MRFKQYLQEEYVTRGNRGFGDQNDDSFEIFKNPTTKELRDVGREVRYIADFKYKNLYVWNSDYIHVEGVSALLDAREIDNVYTNGEYVKFLSTGIALVVGGKLSIIESDFGIQSNAKWVNMDDKWLNKWFTLYNKTMIKSFGNRE